MIDPEVGMQIIKFLIIGATPATVLAAMFALLAALRQRKITELRRELMRKEREINALEARLMPLRARMRSTGPAPGPGAFERMVKEFEQKAIEPEREQ